MNWDQIEDKWAAMTRRVRTDWSVNAAEGKAVPARRSPAPKVQPVPGPDRQTGDADAGVKMSIE